MGCYDSKPQINFDLINADMTEEQRSKCRQFVNAENPLAHKDEFGRDLMMVYLMVASPAKANVVAHIMTHNEFSSVRSDRENNTSLMYAAMYRADFDVFTVLT